MHGGILEGKARGNEISIALGFRTEQQCRLVRRSQADRQDAVEIERCEICGGNAEILHQQPCACLEVDGRIEEEQRLVRVACLKHMGNLPAHAVTRIDTEDYTILIAREHGDGLLPVGIIHIEPLSAPRRSSCGAVTILRIADGNQIATPVEVLKH